MKRIITAAVAAAMLALGLLGAAGPANARATLTVPACRLFTAKDFRAVFHRPPTAIQSEGRSKCAYFFDTGHRQALLVQVRHSRITARFRPGHLYSHQKLAAVEKRAQRHRRVVPGFLHKWKSYINQSHWGLIVALFAVIIAFIVIAEVIHRWHRRRRAATAAAHASESSTPAAVSPPAAPSVDPLTKSDWEDIIRAQERARRRRHGG